MVHFLSMLLLGHLGLKDLLPSWLHPYVWCLVFLTSLFLLLSLYLHMVSHLRTFQCALGFLEWWVPSTQISYIASHSFRRTRWKMLAHLWSRPGIMSLPSYSFGENSHRKAQIQGEGILNTSRSQIQKTTYCLIPFIYCYGKSKIIGMENRLIGMRG